MQNLSFVIRPLKKASKRRRIWDWTSTRVRSWIGWDRHLTLGMLAYANFFGISSGPSHLFPDFQDMSWISGSFGVFFCPFTKGVLIMVTFPVVTGARMLGIHPKTLHHWLKEAKLPVAPHPTDARITCVAEEHLLEVARRHARPLPDLASAPASPEEQARPWSAHEVRPAPAAALLPASSTSPADLIQR